MQIDDDTSSMRLLKYGLIDTLNHFPFFSTGRMERGVGTVDMIKRTLALTAEIFGISNLNVLDESAIRREEMADGGKTIYLETHHLQIK